MKLRMDLTFCTEDGEKFWGMGPFRLLQMVEELGSLHSAAAEMGMAYSKAFKLIKRAEKNFGFPLMTRQIGGAGGGGSVLTPEAKDLMDRYEQLRSRCRAGAETAYEEIFSGCRSER